MVETNPSDEELDPYYQTVDSDVDDPALAQLWTVSQEEETWDEETAQTRRHYTQGSKIQVNDEEYSRTPTHWTQKKWPRNDCLNGTSRVFCGDDRLNGTRKVVFALCEISLNGKRDNRHNGNRKVVSGDSEIGLNGKRPRND
jgi:hypothetical protein